MRVCMCANICMCAHAHMHVYVCACMCVCVCVCACVCASARASTSLLLAVLQRALVLFLIPNSLALPPFLPLLLLLVIKVLYILVQVRRNSPSWIPYSWREREGEGGRERE